MNAHGWQAEPFESVVVDGSGGNRKVPQGDYLPTGKYPVVDQGQEFIGGYCDDEACLVAEPGPWIVFGDHTRAVKFLTQPFCMGADGVKLLKPRNPKRLDPSYLYWFLRTNDLPSAGYSRHYKFLKRLHVPLPPLDEQLRIVSILQMADALRRNRVRAITLLETMAQSLFSEMFGDLVANDRGFELGELSRWVADFQGGKNIAPAPEGSTPINYRVLKVSAITSGTFEPNESKPLPEGYVPPDSHLVRKGDLLFSRANTSALVGATAVVEEDVNGLALPDKLWRFVWRDTSPPNPRFMKALFSSAPVRAVLSRRATGTSGSMKNISKPKVLSLRLGQPDRDLQDAFAERSDSVSRLVTSAKRQLACVDYLLASLQYRAFSGQL